jgi:hypothetical protein
MRALSRLTDLALSSRTSLGVAASVDGLLRVSPELIVPIISVTGGIFGSSDVATATTWLLFFTMLYEFAPLAYGRFERSEAVFSRSNREFRFLFAVGGCAAGGGWMRATDSFSVVFLVLCTSFAAGGGVIAYLSQRHNWNVLDPEGPAVATISRVFPSRQSDVIDDIKTGQTRGGWKRSRSLAVQSLTLWAVFGFPIAIAGIVLLVLSWMFPIADLILFVWAVSIRVFPRLSVGPERTQLADLTGDLQEFFIDVTKYVASGGRGIFTTLFVFFGILVSAGILRLIFSSVDLWLILDVIVRNNAAYQQAIQSPEIDRQWLYLLPWNSLGCLILLLIGGASGLWAWIREFKRLPAAAAVWGEHPAEVDMSSPPPRIPGFILLPTVAPATAAFWVDATRGFETLNRSVAVYDWVVAVAWPVIVIATLWTIYKDRRAQRNGDSNSVTHEHWWVMIGVGIQLTSLSPAGGISVAEIVSPIGLFISLIGFVESSRYASRFDDVRRFGFAGYLILMGVLVVTYTRIFQVNTTQALTLSAVCLLGGLIELWIEVS